MWSGFDSGVLPRGTLKELYASARQHIDASIDESDADGACRGQTSYLVGQIVKAISHSKQ